MPEPVTLDVRPDLKAGREPFSKIMTAAHGISPGGTLIIYAPFEPAPLYEVLRRLGFSSSAERLGDAEGYRVTFIREAATGAGPA
jgi:hypothetical protein